MNARTEQFRSGHGFLIGLNALRKEGATPRSFLFLAVDHGGVVHVALAEDRDAVEHLRVGEKLALAWPFEGRHYYYDSVHRLPGGVVLYDGDRRLGQSGVAGDVAEAMAAFLKHHSAKNVFFGCTPHQPGSWLVKDGQQVALHEHGGLVEIVPAPQGLVARRIVDDGLYFIPYAHLADLDAWQHVYRSPLGNVLMLERRILGGRLVLSCERGVVEVDVSALPAVAETARAALRGGFAVVGRIDGGAFAITVGRPEPWGLDQISPARLVGARGTTLAELARSLEESPP